MAGSPESLSEDDDEFHAWPPRGDGAEEAGERGGVAAEEDDSAAMTPPIHPVPYFQGAFEESIQEATDLTHHDDFQAVDDTAPEMRRRKLLEACNHEDAVVTRWRHRCGAKYHPLAKLMAQIVFGMHLLYQGQAESNEQVMHILQNHVNEVDSFLERTAEDFDLAIKDIEERIRYLVLPMQHMSVFEAMLDDKKFRTELLNGNEKIEKIIEKTAKAMKTAMSDIDRGIASTTELGNYLNEIEGQWSRNTSGVTEIFAAMRGNEQGWMSYLESLRIKGNNLKHNLMVLESVIAQMSKHAAAASRRNKAQGTTARTGNSGSTSPVRSKYANRGPYHQKAGPWLDKPLPREPKVVTGVPQGALAKPHPVPLEARYEQPRRQVPSPRVPSKENAEESRNDARAALKESVRVSAPRESVRVSVDPRRFTSLQPSPSASRDSRPHVTHPGRPQSQIAGPGSRAIQKDAKPEVERCRSEGALLALAGAADRKLIPRKPVGSGPTRKVQSTPVPLNDKESGKSEKSHGNSFSRRISRRLRNSHAPLTNHPPRKESMSRPIDSAYSSAPEHENRTSDDAISIADDTPDLEKDLPLDPEKHGGSAEAAGTARQGHSLFPNIDRPLTPAQAVLRDKSGPSEGKAQIPPRQNTTPKASRTLSLRKFLYERKNDSHNTMVS